MKKLILACVALLAAAIPAMATTPLGYVLMTCSALQDANGNLVANATIKFTPVNNVGAPISFQINGHGQSTMRTVAALVTSGACSTQLADTALTSPAHICYSITMTDNVSGKNLLGPGYTCVQPAGSGAAVTSGFCTAATGSAGGACNFDSYPPNLSAMAVESTGPMGPAGPAGAGYIAGLASDSANGITVVGAVAPKSVNLSNTNPASPPLNSSNIFNQYLASSPTIWSVGTQNFLESFNQLQDGYNNKNGVNLLTLYAADYAKGSSNPIRIYNFKYGIGDTFGDINYSLCYGGQTAAGDEGCEANDEWAIQGNVDYQGTISAGGATGSTSIAVSPTQGSGTQGAGRFLLDLSHGVTTGTVTAMSQTGYTTMTGSGTSWPVSTVNTTLGTAVNPPGSVTVTPGSMTGITTSTTLCVADAGNFETVIPTAVTSTTFTATFVKAHLSTAVVAAGGLCGYFVSFPIDTATGNGAIGNMLVAYEVIRSTSATSMDVWIHHQGSWSPYNGAWSAASNPGYALYPGAEVNAVNNGGTALTNTLTVMPNSVAWANGDTVDEELYPDISIQSGSTVLTKYTTAGSGGGVTGRIFNFNGYINGGSLFQANNGTPASYYSSITNRYPPAGTILNGPWRNVIQTQFAPFSSVISVGGCSYTGTCGAMTYLSVTSTSGSDVLQYNQASGQGGWYLSAGFSNGGFNFSSTGGTQTMAGTGPLVLGGSTQPTTILGTSASLPGASFSSSAITLSPTVNLPGSSSFSSGAITLGQTVTVANGTIASGSGSPISLQPASGQSINLGGSRIYNYADMFAANINATGSYSFVASGWGATSWKMSAASGNFYLSDAVNSVNQFFCTPGTGTTGGCTVAGTATANAVKVATALYTNGEYNAGTCTTALAINPANGNHQRVTLTAADVCALTFTQPSVNTASVMLKVIQSSTSPFSGGISGGKWPGGVVPTITQTSAAVDFISCYLDGTNAYCAASQNFQ